MTISRRDMLSLTAGNGDLAKEFTRLDTQRDRLREYKETAARLSYPAVMGLDPREGFLFNHQTIALTSVKTLMNTLTDSWMPVGQPIWAQSIPVAVAALIDDTEVFRNDDGNDTTTLKNAESLAKDNTINMMTTLESTNLRSMFSQCIKHAAISGQGLIRARRKKKGDYRFANFGYTNFVVERDSEGTIIRTILREVIDITELTDDQVSMLRLGNKDFDTAMSTGNHKTRFVMLTQNKHIDKGFEVTQEIEGVVIHFEVEKNNRYFVVRWQPDSDEDYCQGLIEEHTPDFRNLNALTRAIKEGTLIAAKAVILVDPSGMTKRKLFAKAPNLAVMPGRGQDVTMSQSGKGQDFSIAFQAMEGIETRVSRAVALIAGAIRNAERVSNREVEATQNEIAGPAQQVLSTIDNDFTKGLAKLITAWSVGDGITTKIEGVETTSVSGVALLNKAIMLQKKMGAATTIMQMKSQDQQGDLNLDNITADITNTANVDIDGWFKTDAEREELQRQQAAAVAQAQAAQEQIGVLGDEARAQIPQG